jgi:hypothetical protein
MILRDRIGIDLGQRNRIEDGIHTAIDHGARFLDRHVSLVMLAFAMMAAIRHQVNRSIPKKTKQYPQKISGPHPLVDPGGPPDSTAPRPKTHQSRLHHRMVTLATCPPSRHTKILYQNKITTVMIVCKD